MTDISKMTNATIVKEIEAINAQLDEHREKLDKGEPCGSPGEMVERKMALEVECQRRADAKLNEKQDG